MILAGMWNACSSSQEPVEDELLAEAGIVDTTAIEIPVQQVETPAPIKKQSAAQQFSVQADTVDIQRKTRQGSATSSISVKASAPKKFYTVEVGAFRLQSNIKRHQEELTKRFKLPVRILFDSTINLTRVCVGTFSSKSFAAAFIEKMQRQYPKEYPGLWVSYWTK